MSSSVLIVEDDQSNANLVQSYFERDGYVVMVASDGFAGLAIARNDCPDLVILDLNLPGMDGMELCRILRQESDVPIMMLTARVGEDDILAGLDYGADDYITKPFSPRELVAKAGAVLRRSVQNSKSAAVEEFVYDDIRVNTREHSAHFAEKLVRLTPTEFRLLVTFVREPHRTFGRDVILDQVFGYDFEGFDRTVDAHISNLRRKLRLHTGNDHYLKTVYGVGYRLINV